MKTKDILMDGETLFRDESVFTPNHVPEHFMHRDAQLEEIMLSLKPGTRGVNPVNTFVCGPPGTGKTTAVRYAYSKLAESTKKLLAIYINCEDFSTPYAVFAKIYEAVYGVSPPSTGKPLEDLKERIYKKLKAEDRGMVVALDELDRLVLERNAGRILTDLLKSHSTYGFDRVGVIGITTDETLTAELDDKTRSIYNPTTIKFQRYGKAETRDILADRARYGFYNGVLSESLLDYAAEKTYEAGDVRVGIDLLRRSALLAERDAARKIKKEHMEKTLESLAGIRRKEASESLPEEERMLLDMIKESPGRMSGYFFMRFREKTGAGVKRYNEIIASLERKNLVKAEYKEGIRGRSREIRPA